MIINDGMSDLDILKQELAEQMQQIGSQFGNVYAILEKQLDAYQTLSKHILELKERIEVLEKNQQASTSQDPTIIVKKGIDL
jgi:uncharacterized membrane-anchored protein YhcB (DUF1043 family)